MSDVLDEEVLLALIKNSGGGGGGSTSIEELDDVSITDVTTDHVLTYDGESALWKNKHINDALVSFTRSEMLNVCNCIMNGGYF